MDSTLTVRGARRRSLRKWRAVEGIEVFDNWTDVWEPVWWRPLLGSTWREIQSVQTAASQVGRKGAGFMANHYMVSSGEEYWISGPKRDGSDRLYGERVAVEIDEDVREEYGREVRGLPERVHERVAKG